MQSCEVSVLIPVKNGGALFRTVLSLVLSQKTSFVYEVILIDSGSTDGSYEFACSLGDPRLRVERISPEAFSHGGTRNRAAAMAKGELLVFLVQDAVPGSVRWLEQLTARMADRSLAGVYARQLPRAESGFFVRKAVERGLAFSAQTRVSFIAGREAFEKLSPYERYKLCYFDNVCSCLRRSVWDSIPFDETDFGEDVRWAKKALLAGWRLAFEPASWVYHSHDRPIQYTFKRLCVDHWNLYWLFGMETVPRFRDALRSFWGSFAEHWTHARRAPVPFSRKPALALEAFLRPLAEVSAQYWGVRLAKAGRRPRFPEV